MIDILIANSLKTGCIVDKRAEELDWIRNIPVLKEADIEEFGEEQRIVVLILLQNAVQHDEIAKRLSKSGYRKILYIPMGDSPGNPCASRLRKAYNLMILGDLDDIGRVPYFSEDIYAFKQTASIIERNKKYLTVNIPADLIYSNPSRIVGNRSDLLKYADIPLVGYVPYRNLIDWLKGRDADISEYLADYGINSCKYNNDYTDEFILIRRKQLYQLWDMHFQAQDNFFKDSAPLAEYNEKGYFNLLEGQHRCMYLIRKGILRIPVRITRKDWEKWKQNGLEEIHDSKFKCLLQPCHFAQMFHESAAYVHAALFMEEYYDRIRCNVVDVSGAYGYFGFSAKRIGALHVTIICSNAAEQRSVERLQRQYGYKDVEILADTLTYGDFLSDTFICLNSENTRKVLKGFFDTGAKYAFVSAKEEEILNAVGENIKIERVGKELLDGRIQEFYWLSK